MIRKRALLLVALASCLVWGSAACTAAKTKVVFATPQAAQGAPERVQVFMAANPGIEVEILSLAGLNANQMQDKLFAMIAAGQAVDVIRLPGPAFTQWLNEGYLLDLSTYLRNEGEILRDMHPFAHAAVTRAGRIYGLPEDPTTDWTVVNLGAFLKAGLPSPITVYERGDWTWDTLRDTSRKLRSLGSPDNPYYPITTLLNNDLGLMPWVMGAGGDFFDESGKQVRINSPETKRGIAYALELLDQGLVNGLDAPLSWMDILKRDRWGVAIWWVTFPSWLRQNAPDIDIDVIPLPRSPYKDTVPANINTYVVSSTTKVRDAAFRLAAWLGGPQHYQLAVTGKFEPNATYRFSWPSAYRSADKLFIDLVSQRLQVPGVKYYPDVVPRARAINQPAKAASTATSLIYEELSRVFRKQESLENSLQKLDTQLRGIVGQ